MKKILAFTAGVIACCAAFAGCASKDDVESNPSSHESSSLVYHDSSSYYEKDSSKTIPDRVESTVDDVIDGGKKVVDDTASTAKDVVDNVTQ